MALNSKNALMLLCAFLSRSDEAWAGEAVGWIDLSARIPLAGLCTRRRKVPRPFPTRNARRNQLSRDVVSQDRAPNVLSIAAEYSEQWLVAAGSDTTQD
jgi:hypothetical protein